MNDKQTFFSWNRSFDNPLHWEELTREDDWQLQITEKYKTRKHIEFQKRS